MVMVVRYIATVAAVYATVSIVPGITLTGEWTLLLVALVWSVMMMVVKPILHVLTFPITIVTLGLFSFAINAFLFYAVQWIVPGFSVVGLVPVVIGALILTALTSLINRLL